MTKIMGSIDCGLRLIVEISLLISAFTADFAASGWLDWVMIVVGLIAAGTALISTWRVCRHAHLWQR